MSIPIENRFLREPAGWTDEDGDFAHIQVRTVTDTADKAIAWLVGHADKVVGGHCRIVADQISLPVLELRMQWPGLLPEVWEVERLVRAGLCEAWWRLDISMAREQVPDEEWEAEFRERQAARYAEQKRRAVECRGPWWWRMRYALSQRLLKIGGVLEPDDVGSAMWEDDGEYVIQVIRRPA